jgi:hypothetical protein
MIYTCLFNFFINLCSRYWKRQLVIGKDARRVDNLCQRIYLSYRLLEGTSRFKELHAIVEDAKARLESEVGPLDGMSAKNARGIVSRFSAGIDVQKLCSTAIQRADEWLSSDLHLQGNDHPFIKCLASWFWCRCRRLMHLFLCRFITCCL